MARSFMQSIFVGPDNEKTAKQLVLVVVAVIALLSLMNVGFVLYASIFDIYDTKLSLFADPMILIDVSISCIFAFYIYKQKMWAAVGIIVFQIFDLLTIWYLLEVLPSALNMPKFLLYIGGVRAVAFLNNRI